jgi:hypothetical protein
VPQIMPAEVLDPRSTQRVLPRLRVDAEERAPPEREDAFTKLADFFTEDRDGFLIQRDGCAMTAYKDWLMAAFCGRECNAVQQRAQPNALGMGGPGALGWNIQCRGIVYPKYAVIVGPDHREGHRVGATA